MCMPAKRMQNMACIVRKMSFMVYASACLTMPPPQQLGVVFQMSTSRQLFICVRLHNVLATITQ
jgi:hypothetical protein